MKVRINIRTFEYDGMKTTCNLDCEIVSDSKIFNSEVFLKKYAKNFQDGETIKHRFDIGHNFTVKASTKCVPSDVYDKVTGMRIAESKAFKKVYKIAYQAARLMFREINKERDYWWNAAIKYDDLVWNEEDHINTLI